MSKVAILGGGVAGLSAAHELVERGFQVSVYEAQQVCGGKARSFRVTGANGDPLVKDLPAEHGFRFVPSFYRHLPDTLQRIPAVPGAQASWRHRSVDDSLVPGARVLVAREDPPLNLTFNLQAQSVADVQGLGRFFSGLGLRPGEVALALRKLVELFARLGSGDGIELDDQTWWNFIEANGKSKEYQAYFGEAAVRWTVAMDPRKASARTVGRIALQFWRSTILSFLSGGGPTSVDRLFNGPTSEVWIDPWVAYLKKLGVSFYHGNSVAAFGCQDNRLAAIQVGGAVLRVDVDYDYCIAAIPLIPMLDLLNIDQPTAGHALLRNSAPELQRLHRLRNANESMLGVQFYLNKDVPVTRGGILFKDAPWALTGVSQTQFWTEKHRTFAHVRKGTSTKVEGVVSVIVASWDAMGDFQGKTANNCTPDELRYEIWEELKAHLNDPDAEAAGAEPVLADKHFIDWHYSKYDPKRGWQNDELLFINKVGTHRERPQAVTSIANFFLASDYVKTHTDLATMEGANEAARRAVNGILRQSRSGERPCDVWPLDLSLSTAAMAGLSRAAASFGGIGLNALVQGTRSVWRVMRGP